MLTPRPSAERGHADHGWLDTRHTFSFADYHDPAHMGFRSLRVINEDRIAPGAGFPRHPHRDMEIVTIVLAGALEHRDSTGGHGIIRPGDVQRMTAGTGVTHSEYNASAAEPVHLVQIWILPEKRGLAPGYEQKTFAESAKRGRFCVVASPDGREDSVTIRQDARLHLAALGSGETAAHPLAPGRHAWVQVLRGKVDVNGHALEAGDGAAVSDEKQVRISATADSEVLLFDLA